MVKGKIQSLDEAILEKADLKMTKDEAREWLGIRIRGLACSAIRNPEWVGKDIPITVDKVADYIYKKLVEEWDCKTILEASRAVKLSRDYIRSVINDFGPILFDSEGKPISEKLPTPYYGELKDEGAKGYEPGRPYYASMVSIDEEFEKARTKTIRSKGKKS